MLVQAHSRNTSVPLAFSGVSRYNCGALTYWVDINIAWAPCILLEDSSACAYCIDQVRLGKRQWKMRGRSRL